MENFVLYVLCFVTAWVLSAAALPLLRRTVSRYLLDAPGGLKTHAAPVPVIGGCAILVGVLGSLILIRLCTHFPSGTLHNLRGILLGGGLIFCMGLADDFTKPRGLPVWLKLCAQAVATAALIRYGVKIEAVQTPYLSWLLTFLWIVGLTNAFNLLDIQNGLCVTQALVCTAGLTLITLPREYVYVNFAALALFGACLAFWPQNYHKARPVFLGDSGSNLLGFLIAALSLGYGYSARSNWGFLAPLFMLCVPIFDTAFVIFARIRSGKNPLKGSNDHAALRLKNAGWTNARTVAVFALIGAIGNLSAFVLTRGSGTTALILLAAAAVTGAWLTQYLLRLGVPK